MWIHELNRRGTDDGDTKQEELSYTNGGYIIYYTCTKNQEVLLTKLYYGFREYYRKTYLQKLEVKLIAYN